MSLFSKIFGWFGRGGSGRAAKASTRAKTSASYDLLAIDIDGTLINSKKQLTGPVIKAIRRAADAGVHILMSTARAPVNAQQILQGLGLETQMICYNGAIVSSGKDLRTILHWPLPTQMAIDVIKLVRQINPTAQIRIDIEEKWFTDQYKGEATGPKAPSGVGPIEKVVDRPVSRITFVGDAKKNTLAREQVMKRYKGRIGVQYTDPRLLQLMLWGADKAKALEQVCKTYGVDQKRVMAIGDAPNDLPMMRWAGCAVAVANSYAEVLEMANYTVASNDEHGVAEAIDRYVLNKGA